MKILRALQPAKLLAILDCVHDQSYELDRLQFDQSRHELRIPIQQSRSKNAGTLVVRNVSAFSVRDEALIGEGDINTITYETSTVVIKGAIPVDVTIEVSSLDIEFIAKAG
jgi:hypothetical protein